MSCVRFVRFALGCVICGTLCNHFWRPRFARAVPVEQNIPLEALLDQVEHGAHQNRLEFPADPWQAGGDIAVALYDRERSLCTVAQRIIEDKNRTQDDENWLKGILQTLTVFGHDNAAHLLSTHLIFQYRFPPTPDRRPGHEFSAYPCLEALCRMDRSAMTALMMVLENTDDPEARKLGANAVKSMAFYFTNTGYSTQHRGREFEFSREFLRIIADSMDREPEKAARIRAIAAEIQRPGN